MTTALELLMKFKDEIIKLGKLTAEEFDYQFQIGFRKYLDNQFDKLYYTKTFLFRDEKVPFYKAFFPVNLSYGQKIIDTANINSNLFTKSNFITIIGNAGSGKTMLMKHLFINSFTSLYRIPVIIELRHLNQFDGNVSEYIYNEILENKIIKSERIVERVLESGMFLFLLDGYDEIFSEHKKKITQQIEGFVDQYSNNFYVITSRPGAEAETLERFNNLEVKDLNDEQVNLFIRQQTEIIEDVELADKIIGVISKADNKDYKSYLRNPLLLSMFIFTFSLYPELPRSKNKFYWNVYDTLITKHDSISKRGGYQHERKTGLQNEDFDKILKWFSYQSFFSGNYSFTRQYLVSTLTNIREKLDMQYDVDKLISDLTVSTSLMIIDGLEYKFPHRSFQEYFCASLISGLDPQSKRNVYTDTFIRMEGFASTWNNFWQLCYELDKSNFLELFIIPQLLKFRRAIAKDNSNEISIIEKINQLTGYYPVISTDTQKKGFSYSSARAVRTIGNVISYVCPQFFTNYFSILGDHETYGDTLKYYIDNNIIYPSVFGFEDQPRNVKMYDFNVPRFLHISKSNPVPNLKFDVDGMLTLLDETIDKLNKEVSLEKKQTVSLLSLHKRN